MSSRNIYQYLGLTLVLLMGSHMLSFTQNQGQEIPALSANFSHHFMVDSSCVHAQDPYLIVLRNESTGSIARTQWTTNHPKVAQITPGLKGSTFLNLDILRGPVPENITVTMVATDIGGNKDSVTKTIPLNVHFAPIVRFAEGVTMEDCANHSISFGHTSFSMDEANFSAYAWDFGDGATSTSQSPNHTYQAQGTYYVSLKVTDNTGCAGGDHPAAARLRVIIGPEGQCN
jgi:PKD repeat protein